MEEIDKRIEVEIDNLGETFTFLRGRLEWKLPEATERQKAKQRVEEGTQSGLCSKSWLMDRYLNSKTWEDKATSNGNSSDVWCAVQAPHQP